MPSSKVKCGFRSLEYVTNYRKLHCADLRVLRFWSEISAKRLAHKTAAGGFGCHHSMLSLAPFLSGGRDRNPIPRTTPPTFTFFSHFHFPPPIFLFPFFFFFPLSTLVVGTLPLCTFVCVDLLFRLVKRSPGSAGLHRHAVAIVAAPPGKKAGAWAVLFFPFPLFCSVVVCLCHIKTGGLDGTARC